jgi:hypothetical protein
VALLHTVAAKKRCLSEVSCFSVEFHQ